MKKRILLLLILSSLINCAMDDVTCTAGTRCQKNQSEMLVDIVTRKTVLDELLIRRGISLDPKKRNINNDLPVSNPNDISSPVILGTDGDGIIGN